MFASPWIIGFVIFVVGPALASLYYSVTDYRLGKDLHYIGLDNYRTLLLGTGAQGRRFASAMFNSFYYMVVGVPLQIITSLVMAILLNQNLRGMRFFRLIFYMPVILAGGPAILLAWRYMLASNGGFINVTLQGAAHSFFLFDWIYRGFIFVGRSLQQLLRRRRRGDSIGPFKYVIPALIGFLRAAQLRARRNGMKGARVAHRGRRDYRRRAAGDSGGARADCRSARRRA